MADNSIAVLNVGSQSISLGVFDTGKKGLTLKKYSATSVLADPANEAVRLAQVKVATENLIEQLGVKKSDVLYAVSGQSVFTRFVKLPALGENDIEQLVTFEAQQHIPFPIQEVAWDWELMDNKGAEKEVAIVAIKKDILNDIDEAISDSGLNTVSVESAQISLTNSFFHSYPDVVEPTLIIDAGAKATNLIYIEGKRVFIRGVNVSGISITSAISKEYQVDFAEAERYKTEAGRIALNGAYLQEWDEATSNLATIISNSVSRLPSEISRTTNFYRSQHSGNAPTKVLLAGAGASLPYFKEFIEEKLNLPVEYFNPFRRVQIGGGVDPAQISPVAHTMGEIVGLAIKGTEKNALSIDLVPDSIANRREEARKRPFFIGAVAAIILGSLVWAGAQFYFAGEAKEKLAAMQNKVRPLKKYQTQLQKLEGDRSKLDVAAIEYTRIIQDRSRSLGRLEELRGYFASQLVWLESVEDLVDYLPTKGDQGDKQSGIYVSEGFDGLTYGNSGVKDFPETGKTPNAKKPSINAIMIKGFWRSNNAGQQVVYDILEALKEAPASSFAFELNGKKLDDSELLKVQSTIDEEEYKAPFTMILPLKEPFTLKN